VTHDAVIIGAGHNGLAAGIILARTGWKVLILEAQAEPGGAIRTAEATLPGFRHDLYATNLNAFAGSAFMREFGADLARHGLEFATAAKSSCSIFPDGDLLGITTSLEDNVADIRRLSSHDAERWRVLSSRFERSGPRLMEMLRHPMPSAALFGLPLGAVRLGTQSSGTFVRRHFEHPKVRAMWAVWGMHLDFPPHVRGGALYPYLQCLQTQAGGIRLGRGGARTMVDALAGLFRESGGELRCGMPVSQIVIERGAARGVTVGKSFIPARCAVIGNVAPSVLFRLARNSLSPRTFRHGPGTMMIHLALSDLPDWRDRRAREFAYVHIAPSLDSMSRAYREAMRGALPEEPALIVAQPTIVDPTRAPAGKHVLSIQVRVVPPVMDEEKYADRIVALVERNAPGLRQRILGRRLISPADLERENPNLVGGDSLGGSHHLRQQFVFRPFLGWSRYRTPVKQLFLCGASTWPGAGVGAGSGWLLGRMLAQR
jgi:phytoene dehydrogenase-like protein